MLTIISKYLDHKLALLPDLPGCYLMKNEDNHIIYVGKAKNLKNRVRSYFKSQHEGKTARLVADIVDFETIVTSSDKEAFLLEVTLIQKHQPHYNIKLKQGTGYPYIQITNERDPIIRITGEIKDDHSFYFGPYPNVYAADETMHFIQKVYPLRRCQGNLKRPCLYYHMGQCLGACFKSVPKSVYREQIKKIKRFLNGDVADVKKELTQKMKEAAAELNFERASELRDQIQYIEATVEKQKIITTDKTTRDIINFYVDKGWVSVQIFFIRQSRLLKREKKLFTLTDDVSEEMTTFILQFYKQDNQLLPQEIVVPSELDIKFLSDLIGAKVVSPKRGTKKDLLDLAKKNSRLVLEEKFKLIEMDERKTIGAQREIFEVLKLPYGSIIESFDHSHIQGTDPVSAMVQYKDGKKNTHNYRKYKLSGRFEHQNGADEAANTREVIRRRYERLLKEKQSLPDLILMDGGDIEVNAAKDVLKNELGLTIPVAGMVKNDKHRTSDLIFGEPLQVVRLKRNSQGFYLLQRIQDEVHRFAINFHRQKRSKNSLSSQLETIPGIGPKTRQKLMRHFGSLAKIKQASISNLQEAGLNKKQAQTLSLSLSAQKT